MARIFRLWQKKRGDRRTGSKLVGSVGEAAFFGVLHLLGGVTLTHLIIRYAQNPQAEAFRFGSGYGYWLMVLVSTSFLLIGGGGLILTALQAGTSAERRSALAKRAADFDLISEALPSAKGFPQVPGDANLTNSPGVTLKYRLPVTHANAYTLTAGVLFAVVWNAILVLLVTAVVRGWLAGNPNWLLATFAIPFIGVGGWSVRYCATQIMARSGLGPTSVEISDHPLAPGEPCRAHVSQSGRLQLDAFELLLVCEEEATYRQGTDVRTERQVVYEQPLFRCQGFEVEPSAPFGQACDFEIPLRGMHSFQGTHNTVQWMLVVRGNGRKSQTFDRRFPIVVYPRQREVQA